MDSLFGESPWGRVPRHRQGRQPGQERRGQCNCRNSRCLKLYCECFASGQYCLGCNCQSCHNNPENNDKRLKAIDVTLERNPAAFRPKIALETGTADPGRHNKGCHCKKSGCLKKYCECFQAGITCMSSCKCSECRNQEHSQERIALELAGRIPKPTPRKSKKEEDRGGPSSDSTLSAPSAVVQKTRLDLRPADRARAGIASLITEDWVMGACQDMLAAARQQSRSRSRGQSCSSSTVVGECDHQVLAVLHAKLKEVVEVADASSRINEGVNRQTDGGSGDLKEVLGKRKAPK